MKITSGYRIKPILRKTIISTSVIFLFYLYITPYLSILNFKSAIEKNDNKKVRNYIDFPSVRKSLKSQLKEYVFQALSSKVQKNELSLLGMYFMDPILNTIVDSTINSKGLEFLLNQGQLTISDSKSINKNLKQLNENQTQLIKKPKIKLYYISPSRFVLSSKIEHTAEPIQAYWSRYRIFGWKLYSLQIPKSILKFY